MEKTMRSGKGTGAGLSLGLALTLSLGCRPSVQPTAYVGDGVYEGEPPMCLQQRKESRPGPWQRSLLVHFNNTCDYSFDCSVYNDVTEQDQRVVVFANNRATLLITASSDESSFDIDMDCTWKE
jgi:hypothetical protein